MSNQRQAPSGRDSKRVSEPVYPADILSDAAFRRASVQVKGAWFAVLLEMWRTGASELSGTPADFAHDWNCKPSQASGIIDTLARAEIFDVTLCNGSVTLLCRRLKRRETQRKKGNARVRKHRGLDCNTTVTPQKVLPSSSVSVSSSITPSGDTPQSPPAGGKRAAPFKPPSPDEVTAYAAEIGYPMDGEAWCDCYAQKGWMVGKSKMKDWKAAVRNWKTNGWKPNGGNGGSGRPGEVKRTVHFD